MLDIFIVSLYLLVILVVGVKKGLRINTIGDFAIGTRKHSNLVLLAAIFASLVGAASTLGIAEKTFIFGVAFVLATFGIVLARIVVAHYIAPKMTKFSNMLSVGEIMGTLYGRRARVLTGLATIINNSSVIAAQVSAIGFLFQFTMNISFFWGVIIGGGLIVFYSTFGGIKSVTATDAIQFGIIIIALPVTAGIALAQFGGLEELIAHLPNSHTSLSEVSLPWYKLLGYFIICAIPSLSPVMMQRLLMGRDSKQLRTTVWASALLVVPFYAIMGLIGLIVFAAAPELDPNLALPYLINLALPIGVKGFVIAGLLSAIMSTMDSFLNTVSVAFSHDVVASLVSKKPTKKQELWLARGCSLSVGILAILSAFAFHSVFSNLIVSANLWFPFFVPPLFLGIVGAKGNYKTFWISISSTAFVWVSVALFMPIESFVPAALAIVTNLSVFLLFSNFRDRGFESLSLKNSLKGIKVVGSTGYRALTNFLIYSKSKVKARKPPYELFSGLIIFSSISPFFWEPPGNQSFDYARTIFNIISACLCFCVLVKDYWNKKAHPVFPFTWHFTLFFCLPFQSFLMLFLSGFSIIWLFDILVVFMLMIILCQIREAILLYILGALLGGVLAQIFGSHEVISLATGFGYWSSSFHLASIASCLFFYHQQDLKEIGAIRALSGTMAHSFHTPLASFALQAEGLSKILPLVTEGYMLAKQHGLAVKGIPRRQLELLEMAPMRLTSNATRLQTNIEMLLNKMNIGKNTQRLQKCSVHKCLDALMREYPFAPGQQEKVVVKKDKCDLYFWGNPDAFVLALNELFKNAFIAISKAAKGNIRITTSSKKGVLEFVDTALGVPAERIDKIFDLYFTTTEKGTGLGLYYSKLVMEDIGGSISCESKENCFTRFTLIFDNKE